MVGQQLDTVAHRHPDALVHDEVGAGRGDIQDPAQGLPGMTGQS